MKNRFALNNPKKKKPWFKYYKVYKNDTSIIEVFVNDFKSFKSTLVNIKAACALHSCRHPALFFPNNNLMYYGFLSRIKAMEYAKAGALKYISILIDEGKKGNSKLMEYRKAHYEDLNINLTDRNIRKLEVSLA